MGGKASFLQRILLYPWVKTLEGFKNGIAIKAQRIVDRVVNFKFQNMISFYAFFSFSSYCYSTCAGLDLLFFHLIDGLKKKSEAFSG
jgi:hypothetical protein